MLLRVPPQRQHWTHIHELAAAAVGVRAVDDTSDSKICVLSASWINQSMKSNRDGELHTMQASRKETEVKMLLLKLGCFSSIDCFLDVTSVS